MVTTAALTQTCFSWSSVVVPDSSSLLDSHRVVCPEGSGGGNSAREHIFNTEPNPHPALEKTHHGSVR